MALQVGRAAARRADRARRGSVRGEVSAGRRLTRLLTFALLAILPHAGAARVALQVPAGSPLAGYGAFARRLLIPDVLGRHPHAFWFRPSSGERDSLAARALVLESAGVRVALVSVD